MNIFHTAYNKVFLSFHLLLHVTSKHNRLSIIAAAHGFHNFLREHVEVLQQTLERIKVEPLFNQMEFARAGQCVGVRACMHECIFKNT